ncbi:TolB family protein [Deinococcus psychrotolerans]|uniref:TolB family protein n=1 Tax=Deinococcus psychrotolerans TaxID=2489213 RepID=UPI001F1572C2|nr:hypothetical protein [Deinococcus psychrotolerans]
MQERLSLEALAALPTVAALNISHSGDQVAFYADWTGHFELYTLDLATRERRQVTDGQAPKAVRAGFVWSADDSRLLFSRDHNGDERQALFDLNLASGDVSVLQHAPQSMDYAVDAHPDGQRLLVNSTRGGQMNVHVYNLSKEGEASWTALTTLPNATQAAAWSPDGAWLTLTTNKSTDLRNTDGYVMNADGSGLRRILRVREGSQDSVGEWHPDGKRVAASSDADGTHRVGLLTVETGEVQWLTPQQEGIEEDMGRFSPDGRWLSAIRNMDSTTDARALRHGDRKGAYAEIAARPGTGNAIHPRRQDAVSVHHVHDPAGSAAVQSRRRHLRGALARRVR